MRKRLLLLAVLLGLLGTAQARLHIGVQSSNILTNLGISPAAGLSIGSYDLFGPIGLRLGVDSSVLALGEGGFLELSLDGLYSFGEGVVFYTGAGLGYSSFAGGNATLAALAGLDLDAASAISLFLEVRPTLYVGAAAAVQLRGGVNFHLGASERASTSSVGGEDEAGECCIIP